MTSCYIFKGPLASVIELLLSGPCVSCMEAPLGKQRLAVRVSTKNSQKPHITFPVTFGASNC